jgi:hypothetical protein
MTRQEEIEKIAGAFAIDEVKDTCTCNPASKRGLLYVGFVDGARWADEHPNWISVEDELPEENKWVLTFNGTSINLLMLAGNGGWYDHSVAKHRNVTHLMSLPSVEHLNKE